VAAALPFNLLPLPVVTERDDEDDEDEDKEADAADAQSNRLYEYTRMLTL